MTRNSKSKFYHAQLSISRERSWLIHYSILIMIVALGAILRFCQLDAKALWLDEVIGALFSFGHTLRDVPLDQVLDFSALDALFSLNPDTTCPQITQTVATDSVHPPLYFCLAHQWLTFWQPSSTEWIWVLRSLPALLGVVCILALYLLNRVAFSPTAGLLGAALMAVSPFAVYLSQEARHYTLPMLLTLLTLTGLVNIQRAIVQNRPVSWRWLMLWTILNGVGMYVHYFYILVVLAQVASIGIVLIWVTRQHQNHSPSEEHIASKEAKPISKHRIRQHIIRFCLALTVLVVSYFPWLPTIIHHFGRPETDWLKPYNPDWSDRIAPLYQTFSGWLLMIVAFPIEDQPWRIAIVSALGMLVVGGWLLGQTAWGLWNLWRDHPEQQSVLILLSTFVGCVLLQFFGITYILDKDVTSVPRYNFVYYPGMVALISAGLAHRLSYCKLQTQPTIQKQQDVSVGLAATIFHLVRFTIPRHPVAIALMAGLMSSVFVVYGFVFQKGYYPQKVANDLTFEGDRPVMLAVSYQSLQEVALGLSFALEMENHYPNEPDPPVRIAFIHRLAGYRQVWRSISRLDHDLALPLNLWIVASPGMKTRDYPETLKLRKPQKRGRVTCAIDPEQFNRIGFPYQLFRCPLL